MKRFLTIAVLSLPALVFAENDQDGDRARYAVTITNITYRQVFTPIVVASHTAGVKLFELGQAASVPLEVLAEGGDVMPLKSMLMGNPAVKSVVDSGAMLQPGQSVTLQLDARGAGHISLAAMLIPTNDAFFALNDVEAPDGNKILTFFSPAYDAGTEANDELCANIPGPACGGAGFNASRSGAEGFVHVHRGIHGIGNLMSAVWDWRNPVAQITIRRIR